MNPADNNTETPQRQRWGVDVRISALLRAATRKEGYHRERREEWKQRREDAVARLRSEGIKFNISEEEFEKLVATYASNYRNQPGGITLDQTIVQEIQEAERKAKEHANHVDELLLWQGTLRLFESAGRTHLPVDHEACVYFRLRPDDVV